MPDLKNKLRFFSNARIFKLLDNAGQRRLLEAAEALTFSDGAVVVKEGEPGDAFYFIVDGIASVTADDMGKPKAVAELTDGAFFGEMSVITNQPRSATVTARGQLSVMRIPKEAALKILNDYPKVKELVAKIGVARTEDTLEKILED